MTTRQIIRIETLPEVSAGPRLKVTFLDQFGREYEETLIDPDEIREAINEARRS